MKVAEIAEWVVQKWYDGSKIWRNVYIPPMIDCVVMGLQSDEQKVVERWLGVGLVVMKVIPSPSAYVKTLMAICFGRYALPARTI